MARTHTSLRRQRGGMMMWLLIGIGIVVVIVVVAVIIFVALSHNSSNKNQQPAPAPSYSPFQPLSSGKKNHNLQTDVGIIKTDLKQNKQNLQDTHTSLQDQPKPIGAH